MPAILLALTSHGELGGTGHPTGFYVPEAAGPYRVFTAAGYDVDFVSVQGGDPPRDGVKPANEETAAFLRDHADALADTPAPGELNAGDYAAIWFVGGHGAMWDFPGSQELAALAREIYAAGGVIGAVCHGPAALVDLQLDDGSFLVDGRQVTAFTNAEEEHAGMSQVVPFALETALIERGARFTGKAPFADHAVADGRLVTGQNPASAVTAAGLVVQTLDAGYRHGRHEKA
jgi:putative intracellular protease/amidase